MKKNVCGIDRTLRILIGASLIGSTLYGLVPAWGWIGLIPLATGVLGRCLGYLPFGIKTCRPAQVK